MYWVKTGSKPTGSKPVPASVSQDRCSSVCIPAAVSQHPCLSSHVVVLQVMPQAHAAGSLQQRRRPARLEALQPTWLRSGLTSQARPAASRCPVPHWTFQRHPHVPPQQHLPGRCRPLVRSRPKHTPQAAQVSATTPMLLHCRAVVLSLVLSVPEPT